MLKVPKNSGKATYLNLHTKECDTDYNVKSGLKKTRFYFTVRGGKRKVECRGGIYTRELGVHLYQSLDFKEG